MVLVGVLNIGLLLASPNIGVSIAGLVAGFAVLFLHVALVMRQWLRGAPVRQPTWLYPTLVALWLVLVVVWRMFRWPHA